MTKLQTGEEVIVKMLFGSHLYGTNTPESDTDFKGVFMPTKKQIFLGQIPKNYDNPGRKKKEGERNTSADTDLEIFSLHYFIKMACEGQTIALDMLHAPMNKILESGPAWDYIVSERERFYTKNLKAFVGYARGQAAKYGIKGSRLNAANDVLAVLKDYNEVSHRVRMQEIWNKLPLGEHCHMMESNPQGIAQYQVVGKKFPATALVSYVSDRLSMFVQVYGDRAQMAAENKGIDWKAISHALRAAYQTRQLLTEGTITFPLKEAPYLTRVKTAQLDYMTDVLPELEQVMEEVEELSAKSSLPEKVNRKYWDDFIIDMVNTQVLKIFS